MKLSKFEKANAVDFKGKENIYDANSGESQNGRMNEDNSSYTL